MAREFAIVDVFAREKYAGNQLAVVDATDGTLSDDEMQAVARETNFSETTFVEGEADGGFDVRIFTPAEEIPFAGHPTLGTAAVLREDYGAGREVTLNLGVGPIDVWTEESGTDDEGPDEVLWMRQTAPEFGREFDPELAARALGLPVEAVDDWPVQAVSTGLPTVVVPLRDRDALTSIAVDREAYDALTGGHDAKNVLAFCPDARDPANDLAVRVFAPYYGVPEDPATGSSNGCLAAYLARQRYFGPDAATVSVRVEQGYEMRRPSLLHLFAEDGSAGSGSAGGDASAGDADDVDASAGDADASVRVEVGGSVVRVEVGGSVVRVASGRFH